MRRFCLLLVGVLLVSTSAAFAETPLPAVDDLPVVAELPDPLVMLDGTRITTADDWKAKRKPELKRLFQHYMYGYFPAPPERITVSNFTEEKDFLDGKAILRQATLAFGPVDAPKIEMMLVLPAGVEGPVPVFFGLNFAGNHTTDPDSRIRLSTAWVPERYDGVKNNRATEASRGSEQGRWPLADMIDRGYALATFYCGDIDPDYEDWTVGIHRHYYKSGQTAPAPTDWGTIAAWAYGAHRLVDYLVDDPAIDNTRIAMMGHSRLGKTALLAAAFDERIALVVPNQAGCGGSSPSRSKLGESVTQVNRFGHWFSDVFQEFNGREARLPFDQNCLVALCAPRPVLFTNAQEDTWSDPPGQFEVLKAAEPVYELLGTEGCAADAMPPVSKLVDSRLGYYIRPGKHDVFRSDWKVYLDFAEKFFGE